MSDQALFTILTAPIRSGKTTALAAWIEQERESRPVSGILAPVRGGIRFLRSIASGECRQLDANGENGGGPRTRIGPHTFYTDVFLWAQAELAAAVEARAAGHRETNKSLVVVDEVGPLELRGDGLEPAFGRLVRQVLESKDTELLLVVREQLVERVTEHYRLPDQRTRIVTPGALSR